MSTITTRPLTANLGLEVSGLAGPDERKSVLVGATADSIVDMSPERGRALLDRLLAGATQAEFVVRHQWRRGDLVIWDNTGILHRALPYHPTSRRFLHRTTLAGELAVA
jgi:alpha-ketoglutarate-dependent taurine dioxygenase